MALAEKIKNEMNKTQDEGLIRVFCNALDELGVQYLYDSYVGWILTDGYTANELARMGVR